MRNVRKLYLQNASGERYGLNGENGVYATALAGFGLALTPEYADLGNGFFLSTSEDQEPQGAVSLTAVFFKAPYQTYSRFTDWLSAAKRLTLIYNPTGEKEYCRDVSINSLQKGELTAVGWLEVPCSLLCNAPWYRPVPSPLTLDGAGEVETKQYTYCYTPSLKYGSDGAAGASGVISGTGHIPGALTLSYYGEIANPKIRLVGTQSGKTYGVCAVSTVLAATDSLVFSTRYGMSYVKKISASGVETDLLDELDLSTNPFFHVPVEEPCEISLEADTPFSGRAELLIYYYYRSV